MFPSMLTHVHWEILTKVQLTLDILSIEIGWINSNLPKKAFAMWQHGFLSIYIAFYDIFCSGMEKNQNFNIVFHLFFFSISCLFAAVVSLLSLLPVQEFQRKQHRDKKIFTME